MTASSWARPLPGVALCATIAATALALQWVEKRWAGRPYVEAIVIAILIGVAVRTAWTPGSRWTPGIAFSAKLLLEIAIVLLGASISAHMVWQAGPWLMVGIAAVVALALAASYGIGRALRLPRRLAILIACGNSICGNSAIVAVAPVIGAKSEDIAASIAFTAVLGVVVVLTLPLLAPLLDLSLGQYGMLAGLTVYAVPQVLAATLPVGFASAQVGTLVKLVRVLMLGPVIVGLSLAVGRARREGEAGGEGGVKAAQIVPWFIVGFLAMTTLRSLGLIPDAVLDVLVPTATVLTVIAMAALGLAVDLRVIRQVGGRVTLTVTLSLVALLGISLVLVALMGHRVG
ncbi:hypothetical protein RHODGE_RHODGE_03635 [Rhodoplanes serenus]|uniref:Sulfate exporter family transporter n=1 Tax=Rhodoplanes serenus TaxID=200615 RepID=A0A447CXM1_9BRAD|nr:putative sulfate exporter family transporter [Rhodoplanes serenus]VCU09978.1 hypothetical protein RHODGE_RHODGE_03635 [Rhodoplanes serenus]